MDIKQSIDKNVNQLVENHISAFESKYIPYLIGTEVIRIHVKLDVSIKSVEYETDSDMPIIVDLVDELNADCSFLELNNLDKIGNMFYGSRHSPMLQIDDRYFLCMVGMPHQVTRLEYNSPLTAMIKPNVPAYNLSDGDWVWMNVGNLDISSFALVYRDELYFWNFYQVEHEPINRNNYYKLIF